VKKQNPVLSLVVIIYALELFGMIMSGGKTRNIAVVGVVLFLAAIIRNTQTILSM
jgi:hypothetical protein